MLPGQGVGERGVSRPIVVGLVLLLLFLSTTQDWGSPNRSSARAQLRNGGVSNDITTKTKEEVIRNLIRSNELLEKENQKLRLEIFYLRSDLKRRRSMHNNTNEDTNEAEINIQTNTTGTSGFQNQSPASVIS